MSPVFEHRRAAAAFAFGVALVAAGFATARAATPAATSTAPSAPAPSCAGGICTLDVAPAPDARPCANAPILLAWRQAGGAVLVQCETDDPDMEQPSFVFDRRKPDGPALALQGQRFFDASSLPSLASGGVPDKFADHPLCTPAAAPRLWAGDLLLLRKLPSGDDRNPYCYRVLRVSTTADGIATASDAPGAPQPTPSHARWNRLAARMAALIPAAPTGSAGAGADTARVVHAKAPLRDAPDLAAAPHGYLVQGDAVTILDRGHVADGWLKARYVGKSGGAIDRWIRADDLGLAQPAAATH